MSLATEWVVTPAGFSADSAPRDIALDPLTHELTLRAGDLQLVRGRSAIAQNVKIDLQLFQGEWFLDEDKTEGVPYFQSIFARKLPSPLAVSSVIRDRILQRPGIAEVLSLSTAYDSPSRELRYSFEARTDTGELLQLSNDSGEEG